MEIRLPPFTTQFEVSVVDKLRNTTGGWVTVKLDDGVVRPENTMYQFFEAVGKKDLRTLQALIGQTTDPALKSIRDQQVTVGVLDTWSSVYSQMTIHVMSGTASQGGSRMSFVLGGETRQIRGELTVALEGGVWKVVRFKWPTADPNTSSNPANATSNELGRSR